MNPDVMYHFTNKTLRDGKPIPPIGEWIEMTDEPIPCKRGFHASPTPFDALQYAPGNLLHQVELGGKIIAHGKPVDKYAAQKRRILATIDAEPLMRSFARRCAMDVIHLWDAPAIVREYLETADETKRAAAWDAAWAAARAAAGDAARDAARDAAQDVAARASAWAAARAAARAAAGDKYRGWFNEMVETEFAEVTK